MRLEFGIRNEIEPREKHRISPYLSTAIETSFTFPKPEIDALSPIRTFWEKATLIHVEYHRNKLSQSPDRLSRHWYDLFILLNSWVGKEILTDQTVLHRVIRHKKAFYNSSYANYDDCLLGNFHLIPRGESLNGLESDYAQMSEAGMFIETPPKFTEIIQRLTEFEEQLNTIFSEVVC